MVADLSQFSVMIHQAHWYMRGSEFLTLHPQMDEYMDEVDGFLDEVAEAFNHHWWRSLLNLKRICGAY